jgi:hypothetical protein
MKAPLDAIAVVCTLALLAACGTPGAPRPPSLLLPRPVEDLTATRKGDRVTLAWTAPRQSTDRKNLRLRQLGPTRVCRGINDFPMIKCDQPVGELPPRQPTVPPAPPERATFTDTIPAQETGKYPLGFATYGVESLNSRGRSAGLSNQVQVPLAPTVPAPANLSATVTPDGVRLDFSVETTGGTPGLSYGVRVYRNEQGSNAPPAALGPDSFSPGIDGPMSFLDRTFAWEQHYVYRVAVVTAVTRPGKPPVEVVGDDSESVNVFAHDVFPPAVPAGLQAVYSGVGQKPFVDLTWAPNTDADLAGYNVYRRDGAGPRVKVNSELVKTPAYRDAAVQPGHTYVYSISAVDLRGNESAKSQETSEAVP